MLKMYRASRFSRVSSLALVLALSSVNAFAAKAVKNAKTDAIVIDPVASVLKWEGKKVTGKHHGEIKLKEGELVMNGEELVGGHFTVDMATVTDIDLTDAEYNKKLVTHLMSEDFFDVKKHPTSMLKIKSVKTVQGLTGPTFEVTADLTMKAKSNEVKFPMMVSTKDGKTSATANLTIDRTRWAIKYGSGKFFAGLGDKVIYDDFQIDVTLVSK